MAISYRIYPSIGIARLGDSKEYYIGPEAPAIDFTPDDGSYWDNSGRIKRMGARFRIYEFDDDVAVREITSTDASIQWQVHLRNSKAAKSSLNEGVPREDLTIDGGDQLISGNNKNRLVKGALKVASPTINITLGNLRTDDLGRLVVLGGHGSSGSWNNSQPNSIQNNGWYDDTSDGPVRAVMTLNGEEEPVEVDSAWVVVGSPDFAHPVAGVVTLHDLIADLNRQFIFEDGSEQTSFTRDIYPVLRRTVFMQWVNSVAARGHRGGGGNFLERNNFKRLHNKRGAANKRRREEVLSRLRQPGVPVGGRGNMPLLSGGLTLTELQYQHFEKWANGDFVDDWVVGEDPFNPTETPFDALPLYDQPRALTQAALEACLGGSFDPGIETGEVSSEALTYEAPFKVSHTIEPGGLTHSLSVPWQADYYICSQSWWPSARPGNVLVSADGNVTSRPWIRGISGNSEMVKKWKDLGFIVRDPDSVDVRYIESKF